MTGEELYEMYEEVILLRQNCLMDSWDQLIWEDREVWEELAKKLKLKKEEN